MRHCQAKTPDIFESTRKKLLLESLPVERPSKLAILVPPGPRGGWVEGPNSRSFRQYRALATGQRAFTGLLASRTEHLNLGIDNGTRPAVATIVSGNDFDVLGVRAAAGRLLTPEDDLRPGGHPVAVITHGFWAEALGARGIVALAAGWVPAARASRTDPLVALRLD